MKCYIKENSWIARIAARRLRASAAAIVIGKTIHLYNADRSGFLQNARWLRHELAHIRQFEQHGYVTFIAKYLLESLRNGYYNNKYEVEARSAENDTTMQADVHILNE